MSAAPFATTPGDDPRYAAGGLQSFVTAVSEAGLLGGRVIAPGFGIAVLDSGPGGSLTISSSVALLGFQSIRVTTGSIPLSSTANVTATWPVAFADANYTPVVSLLDASGFLTVLRIVQLLAASIQVAVQNSDGALAHTGTLLCLALHD